MNSNLKFIIIDRLTRARDNGEYFYRYLKENHPEIDILFGLHHSSDDWNRLANDDFNLVDLDNYEQLSAAANGCTHFLFSESNEGYDKVSRVLNRQKTIYIYLNHGCFFAKGNICYPIKKFDYMICGNKREYESVIYNAKKNNLPTNQYILTGLPRVDEQVKLYKEVKTKNIIVIQPWWRENLTGWRVVEKTHKLEKNSLNKLLNSDFVKGYNNLLNSNKFKVLCQENNIQVIFKRHPVMEHIPGVFKVPEWIIDEPDELFIDIFAKTRLYITDYSSNAFETANLGIPCIYFEPDYKNLTVNCNRPEWAWNVKEDGLGPVAFNVDEFITILQKLIKNNFILDEKYLKRRKEQIAYFMDSHNCERCLNAILASKQIYKAPIKTNTKTTKLADGNSNYYLYF